MRHEHDDLFQYGLKNDRTVYIDDVKNGLECDCICPNCGQPLVAYNNPNNKRARHFQHQSLKDCEGVYETIIHYLAKEIIQEQGYLIVPDIDYELSEYAQSYDRYLIQSSRMVIHPKKVFFDKIEVEKSVGSFRPDLKCSIGDKVVYIEIAVTHFIDKEKERKIFKDGNPVLEIDLSSQSRMLTKDQLQQVMTNGIEKMAWVNNPGIQERLLQRERSAREIKEFVSLNRKTLKVYGKDHHIYNCPINARYFDKAEKIKLEDECLRCRCLVNEMEGVSHLGDEPKYQSRTIDCIGHVEKEYINLLTAKGVYVKDKW